MKKIELEIPDGKRVEWVNGVLTLVDDNSKYSNETVKYYSECLGLTEKDFIDCSIYASNLKAIDALNQLFLIAEAWNKEDGFVPDPSDIHQKLYLPWFTYSSKDKIFKYSNNVCCTSSCDIPIFSHRLCFKTKKRAEQFGRQFAYLYNRVLMP